VNFFTGSAAPLLGTKVIDLGHLDRLAAGAFFVINAEWQNAAVALGNGRDAFEDALREANILAQLLSRLVEYVIGEAHSMSGGGAVS
jgi:hypothetical protein